MVDAPSTVHPSSRTATARDGFTLIELLIVTSITGVVVASLAVSFSVVVRVSPGTEIRINDARTTRGLATWLAHDTTSTPRFAPEQAEGGIDTILTRDDCGAGVGQNIVHLTWREDAMSERQFVANYRFVVDGSEGRIVRYTCDRAVPGSFGPAERINLTSGLSTTAAPLVVLNRVDALDPTSEVESIDFLITALGGENVLLQTGSRNPTDNF